MRDNFSFFFSVNTSEVTSGDCASLREQTLQILWAGSLVDQIGIYGNSDSANVSQWISLLSTPPATTSEVSQHLYNHNFFIVA